MQLFAAQAREQIGIAWVVDEDGVACLAIRGGDDVKRLAGALGEQDLAGRQGQMVVRPALRQHLAQRQQAFGFAVLVLLQGCARQFAQRRAGKLGVVPIIGQPATTGL